MTLTYVVDCSLVIDALSARKEDEVLRQRLSAPRTLHAPHHLDVEIASTVRGLAAGKKITDHRGEQMLADYARLRITRHPVWPYHPRMWELRHNLGAGRLTISAVATDPDVPAPRCPQPRRLAGMRVKPATVQPLPPTVQLNRPLEW